MSRLQNIIILYEKHLSAKDMVAIIIFKNFLIINVIGA